MGCAGLIGADFDAHLIAVPAEASTFDAAIDAGPTQCVHAEPPANKAAGQNLGGTQDFWVAGYTVDYGDGNGDPDAADYASIGYDLDRVCTRLGDTPTCVQGKQAPKDGIDGRDNDRPASSFSRSRARTRSSADPLGSKADTTTISVEASRFSSTSRTTTARPTTIRSASSGTCQRRSRTTNREGGAAPVPAWNGTDEWPLRREDTTTLPDGGAGPLVADDNAYVAGNVVVASLPRGSRITGGSIDFDLSGVFVTATIVTTAQGTAMQAGTLAGTWSQSQVLGGLGGIFNIVESARIIRRTSS